MTVSWQIDLSPKCLSMLEDCKKNSQVPDSEHAEADPICLTLTASVSNPSSLVGQHLYFSGVVLIVSSLKAT